jgi:hypothetical protein
VLSNEDGRNRDLLSTQPGLLVQAGRAEVRDETSSASMVAGLQEFLSRRDRVRSQSRLAQQALQSATHQTVIDNRSEGGVQLNRLATKSNHAFSQDASIPWYDVVRRCEDNEASCDRDFNVPIAV